VEASSGQPDIRAKSLVTCLSVNLHEKYLLLLETLKIPVSKEAQAGRMQIRSFMNPNTLFIRFLRIFPYRPTMRDCSNA